jgi:hypothetical protein
MKIGPGYLRTALRSSTLASALALTGCPFVLSDDFEIAEDQDGGQTPADAAGTGGSSDASRPTPPRSGTGGAGGQRRDAGPAGSGGTPAAANPDSGAPDAPVCGAKPMAPGGPCPAACTGGCLLGLCTITCLGEESCAKERLLCPAGFACKVDCLSPGACKETKVHCPERYGCDVSCATPGACKDLDVACRSGSCDVLCGPDSACEGSKVACGTGACRAACPLGGKVPKTECKEACLCSRCPGS